MAITYPLTFPTHTGIASVRMRMIRASVLSMSPFTFAQQTLQHSGQRWEADISLPPMDKARAKAWIGWLASLNGYQGTFLMGDPDGALPMGTAGGTPLVNGAGQTGSTLTVDGASAGSTGWLLAGDYFQLGSGSTSTLHMVTQDADADGSGNVTLEIFPEIRTAQDDDAALTIINPKGLFRLNGPNTDWDVRSAAIYGLSFSAVEAI